MKKNYFIIVSIIEIVLCLFIIIFSQNIATTVVQSFNDAMNMFDEIENEILSKSNSLILNSNQSSNEGGELDYFESLFKTDVFEKINSLFDMSDEDFWVGYYQRFIIVSSITLIVFSVITIIMAKNNHILRNKKRVVVYSIITMIIGCNIFINLIGLINLIVVLCLKRTEEDDYPIPKSKITPLEKTYRSKKEIILAIVSILAYVLLYVVVRKVLDHFFPNLFENKTFEAIFDIVIDLIVLVIILVIYWEELKNGIKALKENIAPYRKFIRRRFIITLIITMAANVIRYIITSHTTSENQLSLFELPFWYLAPIAVIWAPIVEECVFRGALKRIIPNKYVFIIISGLIFGVLHAISESNIFNVIITSIPYCIMGWSFAMAYEKSNNLITNIAMHALNNFIAIVALFVAFGF